jgi:Rod binding domain-containing protein
MSDLNLSAKSYLDFAGLGELRSRAKTNDQSAAQEVGRQFEAMFVQMVFKSVREANVPLKSDLMGSSSVDTFEQMYHQELSQVMAQKGVFGLGDWLSEQVQKQTNTTKAMDAYQQLYGQTSSPAMALDPVAEKRSFSMRDKPVTGIEL